MTNKLFDQKSEHPFLQGMSKEDRDSALRTVHRMAPDKILAAGKLLDQYYPDQPLRGEDRTIAIGKIANEMGDTNLTPR